MRNIFLLSAIIFLIACQERENDIVCYASADIAYLAPNSSPVIPFENTPEDMVNKLCEKVSDCFWVDKDECVDELMNNANVVLKTGAPFGFRTLQEFSSSMPSHYIVPNNSSVESLISMFNEMSCKEIVKAGYYKRWCGHGVEHLHNLFELVPEENKPLWFEEYYYDDIYHSGGC